MVSHVWSLMGGELFGVLLLCVILRKVYLA